MGEDDGSERSPAEYVRLVGQRPEFLEYLRETSAHKRDLIEDLDVSRSTVDRAVRDLQDAGLVRRTDGEYEATAAGALAVTQYRSYIDASTDVRGAREALRPLGPDSRLDPATVVGASVSLTEEPRPYAALDPLAASLRDATRVRAALPNVADSRFVEHYRDRVEAGADVELALAPELADTLTEQFPAACRGMAEAEAFTALEADVPPFGLVLTDVDGVTTVSVVVYTDTGSVHAVVHTGTLDAVQWAENLYDEVSAEATDVTPSFRDLDAEPAGDGHRDRGPIIDDAGSRGASESADGADSDAGSEAAAALPVALEEEGFAELTPAYFDRREARDPATCWRTGLHLVDVLAGYAVDRTRPANGDEDEGRTRDADDEEGATRVDVTDRLFERLRDGTDHVVLGPLGAGKSTVCKAIACRWYERGLGSVLYRESGHSERFESVARMTSAVEDRPGHTLVVVEDAVRADAGAAFALAERFDGDDDVTFLFDAREAEWRDPDAVPVDARIDSYRSETVETVRLPRLDETECARFIERFEATTGADVPVDAGTLLEDVRRETSSIENEGGSEDDLRRGEVLLLFHRLARYARPSADDDAASTAFLEDVERTYRRLATSEASYALRVGVLVNVLNAAQVGVYPEYVHALAADREDHEAIERRLESLEGSVLFSSATEDPVTPREAVHETWSAEFLRELLASESRRRAHRVVADCVSAVLSLADAPDRRESVEWFFEGRRDRLDAVADDTSEWCAELLEQVFGLALKRPALAPLLGTSGYDRFSLPDACPGATRLRCSLWRGRANQRAGDFDRAREEYEYLLAELPDGAVDADTRRRLEASARRRLGRTLAELGELSAAADQLSTAEDAYRELEDGTGVADALVDRGYVHKTAGEYDTAHERLSEALEVYQETEDTAGRAECLLELGVMSHRQGRPEEGRERVETALELYRGLDSRSDEARCLNALGTVEAQVGRPEAAAERFRHSVELARATGDRHREANALNNLARAHKMRGALDEAFDYQQTAVEIYEAIGDTNGRAASYQNLGETARDRGDLDTAADYYRQAIDLREASDHERGKYRSVHSLGVVHLERGEYDDARDRLTTALERFREVGEPRSAAASLRRLGQLALETGDLAEARERTERAVERAREANAREFLLDALEQLSTVHEEAGDIPAAVECCREAVEVAERLGRPERRETLLERCGDLEGAVAAE